MKPEHVKLLDQKGHQVEIGSATWDKNSRSVRNRYPTANGGFSPRSSSEIPINDLAPIIEFIAEHDELSPGQCAQLIETLAASIRRQCKESMNS